MPILLVTVLPTGQIQGAPLAKSQFGGGNNVLSWQ